MKILLLAVTTVAAVLVPLVRVGAAMAAVLIAPPPREAHAMAYDAAHGQVVLFGGEDDRGSLRDTWTRDSTGWTQRTPVHSPLARFDAAMAYDAAHAQGVLFGGFDATFQFADTWTWDGTDWTQRFPAHSPSARGGHAMVYDAARGDVVLFGGLATGARLSDTWTWDGADWTKHTPAHSPRGRTLHAMAYDAAHAQVVLFGGHSPRDGHGVFIGDTWTWDGTDWTKRAPAHSPSARDSHAMAYDAANDQVVLFAGDAYDDTWTWDGIDWTERTPAHSPVWRGSHALAYDAADAHVVLFGGITFRHADAVDLGDTWTWDGTDWTVPLETSGKKSPKSGPPDTAVVVRAWGYGAFEEVHLTFIDTVKGRTTLGFVTTDSSGKFHAHVTIPADATPGAQLIKADGGGSGQVTKKTFTVT
jgi:hypothetical protein